MSSIVTTVFKATIGLLVDKGRDKSGFETFSPSQTPISDPPSQTPYLRPPPISGPPSQTPHLRPLISAPPHLRPPISGPDNVRPYTFETQHVMSDHTLFVRAPTMSDLTLIVRDYNIRPQNSTLFVRDYNIRPQNSTLFVT